LEVQGVYISGNVRNPFEYYMENPSDRWEINWCENPNFPEPDYTSSVNRGIAPKLIFEGANVCRRRKKIAFALDQGLFERLPALTEVSKDTADIAWLVYGLSFNQSTNRRTLERKKIAYTAFDTSLLEIARSGATSDFVHAG